MMSNECHYCHFREPMPFTCKFCGGSFCYNHRLPESHKCPGLIKLKERVHESGTLYPPEQEYMFKKEKRSLFQPVFKALSILKASYSLTILAIALLSFFFEYIIGNKYSSYFALFPPDFFYHPLKFALNLVTHMFIHSGGFHLLFNMMFLYFFGPELERRIGGKKFLNVFFLTGIAGGVGYVLWSLLIYFMFNSPPSPAVGASGALFGVFACLAILAPEIRVYAFFIPIPMKLTQALVFFTFLDIIFIVMGDPIALSAHLSGAAAGLLMGWWIKKKGKHIIGY
ncbi:MAG: rhomboid family intramembrane serine protease [Methanosarcinales archaeon]|nr:MAG: rhomboid family intramembrane serine protease [Methanosarcinales archaeon]